MKKLVVAIALASCSLASFAQADSPAPEVVQAPVSATAPAPAAAAPAADIEIMTVINTLKGKYPSTNFTNVERAPIDGLYEITMGKNIAYTDAAGRYLLFGSVYDMQTRKDLTAPKRAAAEKIDVSKLPLADAFTRVKGDGSRKLYLFSDPDCPFCKTLESDALAKIDNVTIYTFMYPLESLHPQARAKSESVWCLPESARAEAWEALTHGTQPPAKKCDNPIERNIALAESIGFQGTPAMLSEDGRKLPGLVPLERLENFLNGGS